MASKEFDQQFGSLICGIDEVGRGPLCGPVVSACVHIPPEHLDNPLWSQINDSKKISAIKREKLFEPIKELCFYGIAEASAQEIDELNIHHATLLAMKRAYHTMLSSSNFPSFRCRSESSPSLIDPVLRRDDNNEEWDDNNGEWVALIDGKFAPNIPCKTQTVIKGDSQSLAIAAASIIAKVTRDRLMTNLHNDHPHYGWNSNAGYGTKIHMEGLSLHGLTPHHRLSFAPCSALKKKA